jgi:hypothetical protein
MIGRKEAEIIKEIRVPRKETKLRTEMKLKKQKLLVCYLETKNKRKSNGGQDIDSGKESLGIQGDIKASEEQNGADEEPCGWNGFE